MTPAKGNFHLIQFTTHDGLRLNGLLADAGSQTTVIHVHGKGGNFYENGFVRAMYRFFPEVGINFLGFNNRGSGSYVEAHQNDGLSYIGSAVEEISDCIADIDAAVLYCRSISDRVILQGHSFGCEKVMLYAEHKDSRAELILLSPSDGYRLQSLWISPETVEDQLSRLKQAYRCKGLEWLPENEYGIRAPGVNYHVPITAEALTRLIAGPAFSLIRLDGPARFDRYPNRAFAYVGAKDALQVDGAYAMIDFIRSRFPNGDVRLYSEGDHHLRPIKNQVLSDLAAWISVRQ